MPTIITIGRAGNQWFHITQSAVSAHHATLTIPDNRNEPWILEDNHSSNGTFIRDENGKMVRIGKVEVSPLTFIQLGPGDVAGCSFYATRCEPLRQQDSNKYVEFQYMRKELSRFETIREKENKIKSRRRWANRFAWPTAILIMWIWDLLIMNNPDSSIMLWLKNLQDNSSRLIMGLIIKYLPWIITTPFIWWVNGRGKLDSAEKRFKSARRCPNPMCHNDLSDNEIEIGRCRSCKAEVKYE